MVSKCVCQTLSVLVVCEGGARIFAIMCPPLPPAQVTELSPCFSQDPTALTPSPCILSHGTRAMGNSSSALQPPFTCQTSHMRMRGAAPHAGWQHCPKTLGRPSLAKIQSVKHRPKIRRKPERRWGNGGWIKMEERRGTFPLSFTFQLFFSLFA